MGNSGDNNRKLNNFIVQGGILAFAGVFVRMLGLFKRIPQAYIIGDIGNSYYSAAYEIYNLFLTISAYGIPLSVSKLVSARVRSGQYRNADKLFKCALGFALTVGLISSTALYVFSDRLAAWMNEPMSALPLKVLTPTLFIVSVMAVFRGYFQGLGTMIPTAFSQILEQIVLIAVGLSASFILSKKGLDAGLLRHNENFQYAYGAAGITLGCAVGALVGLIFMILLYRAYRQKIQKRIYRDPSHVIESTGSILKEFVCTIIPVLISNTVNNISNLIDQFIHNKVMTSRGLLDIKTRNWGIYSGKYSVLINVPIAMASAMSASSVPTISGLMKRKEYGAVSEKISAVVRITMFISIPCCAGFLALAPDVMFLLFGDSGSTGATLVRIGSFGVVLFSFSTLTNGILQGMSQMRKPIIHGIIGLCVHVPLLVLLLNFTKLNIYAVAFSNNIFSLVICILNMNSIKRILGYKQEILKTFVCPIASASIMGVLLMIVSKVFMKGGYRRSLVVVEILIGIFVYFVSMLAMRAFGEREIKMLPGGTKIYRLLSRMHLMK